MFHETVIGGHDEHYENEHRDVGKGINVDELQVGQLQLVSDGAQENKINGSTNICRKGKCVAEGVKSQIGPAGDEGANGDECGRTNGMYSRGCPVQKAMDRDDKNHAGSAQCVVHEQTGELECDE